jgi:hypothetical protein
MDRIRVMDCTPTPVRAKLKWGSPRITLRFGYDRRRTASTPRVTLLGGCTPRGLLLMGTHWTKGLDQNFDLGVAM